jgi:hypothetical protein
VFADLLKEILFCCVPFVKKLIYKKELFANDIKIIPRVSEPVIFNLSCEIPTADIYLTSDNKSQYLEATLEGIVFSLWLHDERGLHLLAGQEYILPKKNMPKKCGVDLYRQISLTESQVNLLRSAKPSREISVNINLQLSVSSKLYCFEKSIVLENVHCRISS